MAIKKSRLCFIAFLCIFIMMAGCSNQIAESGEDIDRKQSTSDKVKEQDPVKPTEKQDPVKITLFNQGGYLSEERLEKFFKEPMKKHLPHITLEVVTGNLNKLEELIASKTFPDLIYSSNPSLPDYINAKVLMDLSEPVKQENFDLERFDPVGIDAIRSYGQEGELFAVPFSTNMAVLIYNKDIFDKFGVSYPKDGMTWDEAIDVGRNVTRTEDGTHYIGFDPGYVPEIAFGMSLPFADAKAGKALLDTDQWKMIFEMLSRSYAVPGFIGPKNEYVYGMNVFFKEKRLAMMPIWLSGVVNNLDILKTFGWDIVTIPNFQEFLGRGREVDMHVLAISSLSKHKEAAFDVIKLATSDEVQLNMSVSGTTSVLTNPDIRNVFGKNLEAFQEKNIQAFFKTTPGHPRKVTLFDTELRRLVDKSKNELAIEKKDVNTYMRDLQEQANQKIELMK